MHAAHVMHCARVMASYRHVTRRRVSDMFWSAHGTQLHVHRKPKAPWVGDRHDAIFSLRKLEVATRRQA